MKPIAGPQTARVIILSFVFFALLILIDACKEDSSTSPVITYPAVAGQWSGVVEQPPRIYDVTWSIAQSTYTLSGTSLWTIRSSGSQTECWFVGTINTSRQVALQETSYVPLNWSGSGWALASYSGRLNTTEDSLGLTWQVSGGGTGDFVLTKQ